MNIFSNDLVMDTSKILSAIHTVKDKIIEYDIEFLLLILFILYVIVIIFTFKNDPCNMISNNKAVSILFSLFGGFIIIMTFMFYHSRKELFTSTQGDNSNTFTNNGEKSNQLLQKYMLYLFSFGAIATLVYFFIKENNSDSCKDISSTLTSLSEFYEKRKYSILSVVSILIAIASYYYYKHKSSVSSHDSSSSNTSTSVPSLLSFLQKMLSSFAFLGIVLGITYAIFYTSSNYTDFTKYFLYALGTLGVIGAGAFIIMSMGASKDKFDATKPSWLSLFYNIVTYLPCLMISLVDYIKYQYNITTKPIVILLFIELALIASYFIIPYIVTKLVTHNATRLLKEPIGTNNTRRLGEFQDLNYKEDNINYHYAVSCWVYLNSMPPETNSSYEEYTSLLNIGNKPNILYNVSKNKLMIKVKMSNDDERIICNIDVLKYQNWNNIVVNYDGGILDVFINNELVGTQNGVIPYKEYDVIQSGSEPGISGGICNVMYFNDSISRNKISWLYHSAKHFSPPVL